MGFQVTEVQKALHGVDYPVSSEQLASAAENNGADAGLVDSLRKLDKDRFDGPNAVMSAMKGDLGNDSD